MSDSYVGQVTGVRRPASAKEPESRWHDAETLLGLLRAGGVPRPNEAILLAVSELRRACHNSPPNSVPRLMAAAKLAALAALSAEIMPCPVVAPNPQ